MSRFLSQEDRDGGEVASSQRAWPDSSCLTSWLSPSLPKLPSFPWKGWIFFFFLTLFSTLSGLVDLHQWLHMHPFVGFRIVLFYLCGCRLLLLWLVAVVCRVPLDGTVGKPLDISFSSSSSPSSSSSKPGRRAVFEFTHLLHGSVGLLTFLLLYPFS